jgi:hypothetical protein
MRSAEIYPKWIKNRPKKAEAETIVDLFDEEISESRTILPEPLFIVKPEPGPSDLLRLMDRLLESGSYERATETLNILEPLCTNNQLLFEFAIRKARMLLRMHDSACETWLLQSDELCVRVNGEDSPRRRLVIDLLQQWYASTGESGRVLYYAEVAGKHLAQENKFSRERVLKTLFVVASHLNAAGHYSESVRVLNQAIWELVLEKDDSAPSPFTFDKASVPKSVFPLKLLMRIFLLLAKNWTEVGNAQMAVSYLQVAEDLGKPLVAEHELKARFTSNSGACIEEADVLAMHSNSINWPSPSVSEKTNQTLTSFSVSI